MIILNFRLQFIDVCGGWSAVVMGVQCRWEMGLGLGLGLGEVRRTRKKVKKIQQKDKMFFFIIFKITQLKKY